MAIPARVRRSLRAVRPGRRRNRCRAQRTQSRPVLVETARLAAQSMGARVFDVVVPTPASAHPVPIRSTGASQAIAGNDVGHRRAAYGRPGDRLHRRGSAACARARPDPGRRRAGADDLQRASRHVRPPRVGRRSAAAGGAWVTNVCAAAALDGGHLGCRHRADDPPGRRDDRRVDGPDRRAGVDRPLARRSGARVPGSWFGHRTCRAGPRRPEPDVQPLSSRRQ